MTAAVVFAGTVASYLVGWLAGSPILVPIVNTLAAFPFMLAALRRGRVNRAVGLMLVWALAMGVSATLLSYGRSAQMDRLFINGEAYRQEMFAWVLTGQGAESNPRVFVPQHLTHLGVFCLLSVATGSMLSMPMGAVLMNYMGHYVGSLAAASQAPLATMVLAWHPWSIVRVASFVVLGVLLSGLLLKRVAGFKYRLRDHRRLLAVAGLGIVADIGLKAILAPAWRLLLLRITGW